VKRIYTILVAILMTASVWAQAPQKMSYQAVIRNSTNNLVTNTNVGMQISILQTSTTGTAVYVEQQSPTTNANGLVSIEIGTGTVVSGDFSTIDWGSDTYFIKTETDPNGGSSYTITGVSQLLSVPYALHAKTAESVNETDPIYGSSVASQINASDTVNWNNKLDSYTESDPIYGASVASQINASDTVNWNNKLDSYTESDPIYGASVASQINATDTVNWNNKLDSYTESDPIYGASVASQINASDTVNWNNKLDSYTESDPIYGASVASQITVTDTTNWNNHTIDTHIDSTGIVALGFVAGPHTDSTAIANMGFVAGSGSSGSSGHFVGELFGGGIVFYVYNNGANGLIASLDDLDGGSGVAWSANTATLIGPTAQSFYNGASNTAAMVAQDTTANKAGTLCNSYAGGGFTDWYLPAIWELNLLYNSAFVVSNILANDGNGATQPLHPENVGPTYGRYWASTEYNSTTAWNYNFHSGGSYVYSKSNVHRVRAVRAF